MFVPIGLVVVCAVANGLVRQPKSVLTWVTVAFLAFHSSFSVKEDRFLHPLVAIIPFVACLGLEGVWTRIVHVWRSPLARVAAGALLAINVALYALRLYVPLEPRVPVFSAIYYSGIRTLVEANGVDVYFSANYYPLKFYRPPDLRVFASEADVDKAGLSGKPFLVALRYPDEGAAEFPHCPIIYKSWPLVLPAKWRERVPWPFDPSAEHDPYWWTLRRCL
jgi:hypothetical protein